MKTAREVIATELAKQDGAGMPNDGHYEDAYLISDALDSAGYVIVPKEATASQLLSGGSVIIAIDDSRTGADQAYEVYRAMIESRPK